MIPRPPIPTLFPYTTLFRSQRRRNIMNKRGILVVSFGTTYSDTREKTIEAIERELKEQFSDRTFYRAFTDRKSTRLNSSHVAISYAVFCLKKKKKEMQDIIV